MKDVDTMVNYANDGNDEKLVEKIHLVSKIMCMYIQGVVAFEQCGQESRLRDLIDRYPKVEWRISQLAHLYPDIGEKEYFNTGIHKVGH